MRTLGNDLWSKHTELVGIDINEEKQLELLSLFASRYKSEYAAFPKEESSVPYQYYTNNGYFESVDSEILYCMVRHFKPGRILEIGSGYSTFLSAQAVLENSREDGCYKGELKAICSNPLSRDRHPLTCSRFRLGRGLAMKH